ncbi:MAG: hypothetical protein WD770_03060 [Actinomycetota bacterium]
MQVVEKPFTRRRGAGLVWGAFAAALFGGLLLGGVAGGMLGDSTIEGAIGAFTVPAGSIGLLVQLARRAGVGFLPCAALFLTTWAGTAGIFYGARAAKDLRYMAQIRAWFGTLEARLGVVLVLVGLALAIALSLRRPGPAATEGG